MLLEIDDKRCIQCGTCVEECPRKALSLEDGKVVYNAKRCMMCGHCLAVCPRDCIIIDGGGYDCEEVEDLGFAQIPSKGQYRNLVLARRSVRRYTDVDVTEDELKFILETGKYAPTGMNRQGNQFVVVRGDKVTEMAADAYAVLRRWLEDGTLTDIPAKIYGALCKNYEENGEDGLFFKAPLVIFVYGDTDVDGAICATTMGFAAQTVQLGACFARLPLKVFEDAEFAAKWQAPEGKKLVVSLLIGNPEPEYFSSVPRRTPKTTVIG